MQTDPLTRRNFLKESVTLATPMMLAAGTLSVSAGEARPAHVLKVVCVGGHPDDPESGCAGTLARYAELGHSVTVIYLTRGERGIRDKSLDEAARIRSAECENACKIVGARPVFFGQIDGATEMTRAHVDAMTKQLAAEKPEVVFAHWPIDTHMDHQVASFLAIRACMEFSPRPQLYFFEVNSGSQTQGFLPNTYVDISSFVNKKKSALFAHVSQDGQGIWRQHHEPIATWRGREAGVTAAEAFVHLNRHSQASTLPGI
ncbi:MAG TPA: PIG-L deacetylase family protein [Verrucomicrobiae bacterium]|nr:PIG-L deacetylase family protein [Verrucomicrobiae bacterium]